VRKPRSAQRQKIRGETQKKKKRKKTKKTPKTHHQSTKNRGPDKEGGVSGNRAREMPRTSRKKQEKKPNHEKNHRTLPPKVVLIARKPKKDCPTKGIESESEFHQPKQTIWENSAPSPG